MKYGAKGIYQMALEQITLSHYVQSDRVRLEFNTTFFTKFSIFESNKTQSSF